MLLQRRGKLFAHRRIEAGVLGVGEGVRGEAAREALGGPATGRLLQQHQVLEVLAAVPDVL